MPAQVMKKNMMEKIVEAWKEGKLSSDKNEEDIRETLNNILTKPKSERKRKIKDPQAPKRAKSAYIYFCQDKRADIVKEHPDLPFGQIARILGQEWKKQKELCIKTWEKMSKKDKERYENEMENYTPPSDEELLQNQKKKKKKKSKDEDLNPKPKRPMSIYIRFCGILRERFEEFSVKDLSEMLGESIDDISSLKGSQKTKIF